MFIKVKVFPASKKEEVFQIKKDEFEIRVKEKPKQGRANQAVLRVLASYFNVPIQNVRLLRGYQWKNKIFEVDLTDKLEKEKGRNKI